MVTVRLLPPIYRRLSSHHTRLLVDSFPNQSQPVINSFPNHIQPNINPIPFCIKTSNNPIPSYIKTIAIPEPSRIFSITWNVKPLRYNCSVPQPMQFRVVNHKICVSMVYSSMDQNHTFLLFLSTWNSKTTLFSDFYGATSATNTNTARYWYC